MCMLSCTQAHISHFTRSRVLLSPCLKTECLPVPFALAHGMRGARQPSQIAGRGKQKQSRSDSDTSLRSVFLPHRPRLDLTWRLFLHRNKPMQSFTLSSSAAGVRTDLASPNKLHAQFKRAALVEPIHP